MAFVKPKDPERPVIDLRGPDGNAFIVIGLAKRYGTRLRMPEEQLEAVIEDMRSDDYSHLVAVFEKTFGKFIDIILPEGIIEDVSLALDTIDATETVKNLPMNKKKRSL